MDVIFLSVKWKAALLYLDDIFVLSKTAKYLMAHLCQVLTLPGDNGEERKLKNCLLPAEKIDYL